MYYKASAGNCGLVEIYSLNSGNHINKELYEGTATARRPDLVREFLETYQHACHYRGLTYPNVVFSDYVTKRHMQAPWLAEDLEKLGWHVAASKPEVNPNHYHKIQTFVATPPKDYLKVVRRKINSAEYEEKYGGKQVRW